jgi:chitinase
MFAIRWLTTFSTLASSKPGPNAPLRDNCGNSTQPEANAVAAVKAWTAARFPVEKLVLGLPSYGYISASTASRLRTRAKVKQKTKPHSLKIINEEGGSVGQVQFNDLVRQGALIRTSEASKHNTSSVLSFIAGSGFERRWDSCSETPFLRSTATRQVITYDDLESLQLKTVFAREVGMLGVNLFDVHGDTVTWDLTDCIRKGLELI